MQKFWYDTLISVLSVMYLVILIMASQYQQVSKDEKFPGSLEVISDTKNLRIYIMGVDVVE